MPVTKITLSTAMRARDVSRPADEHLTEAAAREDAAARLAVRPSPGPRGPASGGRGAAEPGPRPEPPADRAPSAPVPVPSPPVPAAPRRRRRRGR